MSVRNEKGTRKGINMRVKLRELRKSYNMTQECIAKKLYIHRTHYNHIENGHKGVTLENAIKLKKILNYKDDDLFENI